MTTVQLPTEISPNKTAQLDAIEHIRKNHPVLLANASSLRIYKSEPLTIVWSRYMVTQGEMILLCKMYPDAGWKPKANTHTRDLDYIGTIDGVTIVLESAESVPLERLPDKVNVAGLKVTAITNNQEERD